MTFRFNRRWVALLLPLSMLCLTAQAQSAGGVIKRKTAIAESAKNSRLVPHLNPKGRQCQRKVLRRPAARDKQREVPLGDKVYTVVEVQPTFRGNLSAWISDNLRYPAVAQENDIQGRVVVKFIVDKDGNINQAQIVRGVDPALDNEAIRLVSSMPKWNPGTNRGEPVSVWFTLPITFCFQ